MIRIALRMIFGARGRYTTLVLGLAFAVLLSTQQVAILLGVLRRATRPLQNVGIADLWVVSHDTLSIDEIPHAPNGCGHQFRLHRFARGRRRSGARNRWFLPVRVR
jgi:hypothetical protein